MSAEAAVICPRHPSPHQRSHIPKLLGTSQGMAGRPGLAGTLASLCDLRASVPPPLRDIATGFLPQDRWEAQAGT